MSDYPDRGRYNNALRDLLILALKQNKGRRDLSAKWLGVSSKTVYNWTIKYPETAEFLSEQTKKYREGIEFLKQLAREDEEHGSK